MSYIDTIDHELVGFFAGLPVYHPLESIMEIDPSPRAFNCTPDQLVIGGGSGEHPGLVLRRPDCAVAYFVSDWMEKCGYGEGEPSHDHVHLATAAWERAIDTLLMTPMEEILYFAGWTVKRFHDFYVACQSIVLHTPYNEDSFPSFEAWLVSCLGEFVFFSMPELVPNLDRDLPGVHAIIREAIYTNILVPPPGYRLPLGRSIIDGRLQWGNIRWGSRRETGKHDRMDGG